MVQEYMNNGSGVHERRDLLVFCIVLVFQETFGLAWKPYRCCPMITFTKAW